MILGTVLPFRCCLGKVRNTRANHSPRRSSWRGLSCVYPRSGDAYATRRACLPTVAQASYGEGMTEDEHRIIGTREAADLLGWSQRKVQRKADTGQIPVIRKKIGERREYIFDADAIAALAERSH